MYVYMIEFSWNEIKAKSNLKKHGVSFEEAQSVFYDDLAVQFYDEDSSDEEMSFQLTNEIRGEILETFHDSRCALKIVINF